MHTQNPAPKRVRWLAGLHARQSPGVSLTQLAHVAWQFMQPKPLAGRNWARVHGDWDGVRDWDGVGEALVDGVLDPVTETVAVWVRVPEAEAEMKSSS